MTYTIKLLPANIEVRHAKWVLYRGEIYRHLPEQRREDKDISVFTFIKQDHANRGYHEKIEDLIPLQMCLCSKNFNEGDKFWYAKTSHPYFEEEVVDKIHDGYIYPGVCAIRFNINWVWKKEAIIDDDCSWIKQNDQIDKKDVKLWFQSDDRKVKHIVPGDPVFTLNSNSSFYEIEATVKEIQQFEDSIDWWDALVILTDVREQVNLTEGPNGIKYTYRELPDMTVTMRDIRYRPNQIKMAYIKCPTCKK